MKQALIKRGRVVTEELPSPSLSSGQVMVQVSRSCISAGTEVSGVQGTAESLIVKAVRQPAKVMRTLDMARTHGVAATGRKIMALRDAAYATGYSASGIVVDRAADVTDFQIGDRVAVAGAGYANHAEYVAVPVSLVSPIPVGVSDDEASTVALGAIAMQGVRRAQMQIGEYAVVVGSGILGLLTIQMLVAAGVRVMATDIDERRAALARRYGAEIAVNPVRQDPVREAMLWTDGHGADVVIFTAATPQSEPLSQSFQMCRRKGRVVMVGVSGMEIKREDIYAKELDFIMATSYGPGRYDRQYEENNVDYPYPYVRWTQGRNMQEYLRLLSQKKIDVEPMIGGRYDIDKAGSAFEALQGGEKPLIVLLSYDNAVALSSSPRRVNVTPARTSEADAIRVGIIGTGGWASSTHMPILQSMGGAFSIHGLCNRTASKAQNLAREFGASFITSDPEEIIASPDIDLVVIATRHDSHGDLALRSLRGGKHVFVEKPLAVDDASLSAIEKFYEGGAGTQPLLMTGFNRRFSKYIQSIRGFAADRKNPMILNYRMNAGYMPPDHWTHEDGGRIVGECCHLVDTARFLVGAPVRDISVQSLNPRGDYYAAQDNKVLVIRYEDGSMATIHYFSCGAKELSKEYLEVHFDGKSFVMDNYQSLQSFGIGGPSLSSAQPDKGAREEWQAVHAALARPGSPWPIPLDEMLETSRLCLFAGSAAADES